MAIYLGPSTKEQIGKIFFKKIAKKIFVFKYDILNQQGP